MGAKITQPKLRSIDRGDPGSDDFVLGDLTTDGAWHDLDLSAIVPAAAKEVKIKIIIQDDLVNGYFEVSTKGHSNIENVGVMRVQVANQKLSAQWTIPFNNYPQIIQYKASNVTWTLIEICVMSWLI